MSQSLLICTDLDRTLIPNGPQPESALARERFAALVGQDDICLAYVSGRHRALVEQAIDEFHLPVPDFVIGDVGTTIYRVGAEHLWQYDKAWEKAIARDWAGYNHAQLAAMLADVDALRMQEAEKQNHCKLSYYMPLDADGDAWVAMVESRLSAAGIRCRAIYSIDEEACVGLLDILPQSASKLHAIEALISSTGFDLAHTVFCGDSGNDMEVLVSSVPSVLVANATEEVRAQALAEAENLGNPDALYIASGGLMGMNGNYAAGMLEGIAHYHSSALDCMQLPSTRQVN